MAQDTLPPISTPAPLPLTVVIPMLNEAGNVTPVLEELAGVAASFPPHEIIVVDDGSRDATLAELQIMAGRIAGLRVICHAKPAGKSAALHSAVASARGAVICTMDGDGQNPPEALSALFAPLMGDADPALALVAGQRVGRRDTLSKRYASRVANALRRRILRDDTRDTACGLKAFRRAPYLDLPYFHNMHRYLPALFRASGHGVAHVDVADRPRNSGRSKYSNLQRALVGVSDLLAVAWLIRNRNRAEPTEIELPR
ncbi:MAG: glycosyltransferase family 2 protein [Pseudomonadota bacterium]